MSTEMERKLSEIARIDERYPRFVALAGSLKDADQWEKLVECHRHREILYGRLTKALERNPYATLICAIFKSLTSVSGFNSAYIQK